MRINNNLLCKLYYEIVIKIFFQWYYLLCKLYYEIVIKIFFQWYYFFLMKNSNNLKSLEL